MAQTAMNPTASTLDPTNRDDAIKLLRAALAPRCSFRLSITGGRGTSWGWILIKAAPSVEPCGELSADQRAELARLLGLETVHHQGVDIPASGAHRREYIDRANGRTPSTVGTMYWD